VANHIVEFGGGYFDNFYVGDCTHSVLLTGANVGTLPLTQLMRDDLSVLILKLKGEYSTAHADGLFLDHMVLKRESVAFANK